MGCTLASATGRSASAQWQATVPVGGALGAPVGSDAERYLRALSVAGVLPQASWAIRPFDADDVAALLARVDAAAHPRGRGPLAAPAARASVGAAMSSSYNTGFAWGANDGPQWQGRGANLAAGAAASIRIGPLRATLAPTLWYAENRPFPLLSTFGRSEVSNGLFPNGVDLPQRFGTTSLARLAPGESALRLSIGGVALGVATTAHGWAFGESFPGLLGPNAGGFAHVFAGTSARGVRLPLVGRVAARYVLGTLEQSAWSPVTGPTTLTDSLQTGTRRVGVGLAASWMPAFVPELEVGAARFFHSPYRRQWAWSAWRKPFEELLKEDVPPSEPEAGVSDVFSDADNQLASFFVRWRFPHRGVEIDAELFRDDHNWDRRDLAQEPENASAIAASVRVATERTASRVALLTLEFFDGDVRAIAQQRPTGFLYTHTPLRQGHTQRGQLLGSPIGVGGITGQRIAWERFAPTGSLRVTLQRWQPQSRPSTDPQSLFPPAFTRLVRAHDWVVDASVGGTRVRGATTLGLDAGIAYAGVRHFGGSRTNLYLRGSWQRF